MENILHELRESQLRDFPLAKKNYSNFDNVKTKSINFGSFKIYIQYNPDRIVSTGAKLDEASITKRKCFLCSQNMPKEQIYIEYNSKFSIYINPFPIFSYHFTIPAKSHTPQRIKENILDLLNICKDFSGYSCFYNGPKSGASIPDHMHFQLVNKGTLQIEEDYKNPELSFNLCTNKNYSISVLNNYIRKVIILKSKNIDNTSEQFSIIYNILQGNLEIEPMMNIIAWFDKNTWIITIFPRKAQRPKEFFMDGKEKIMFSPGCADVGGLVVAPRMEDYNKYNKDIIHHLFEQVVLDDKNWSSIIKKLQNH